MPLVPFSFLDKFIITLPTTLAFEVTFKSRLQNLEDLASIDWTHTLPARLERHACIGGTFLDGISANWTAGKM
ncbi:hypothetical protein PtA15_16A77 [Puccinia triticina]|uniref:Uncharacterized protein n=1 Tax=Puccinia triticina TaxID=208348 RepID=A0ABY7D746_9BASI|nr:uncharacterized protein PtA15_16A77 [Puccinia triticina]WAQ92171.1 hypothetical protein PtA15_16A77 [Puccinia triticina]WAR63914.1 hypothetical protein PtB15_16B73 [Puccinia triticina]